MREETKKKLERLGIDLGDLKKRLNEHVGEGRTFANPQKYAQAIQYKESAGIPLSDPQTARDFKMLNPDLFGKSLQYTDMGSPGIGTVLPQTDNPDVNAMLQAVVDYQRANPFVLPYAPGTPTQRRLEAEEAARQFELTQDLAERKFAHEVAQDRIANALAWSRLNAPGGGEPDNKEDSLFTYDPKAYAEAYKIAKQNYEKPQLFWVSDSPGSPMVPYEESSTSPGYNYELKELPSSKVFEHLPYNEQKQLIDQVYYTLFGIPTFDIPNFPSSYFSPGTKDYYMEIAQTALNQGYTREDVAALLVEKYNVRPDQLGEVSPDLAGMYKRYPQAPADIMKRFRSILGR